MATPAPRLELHGFAGGGSAAKAAVASADRIVTMMTRCIALSPSFAGISRRKARFEPRSGETERWRLAGWPGGVSPPRLRECQESGGLAVQFTYPTYRARACS